MHAANTDEDRLLREAADALRQGRAAESRSRLDLLVRAGSPNPLVWLLLAIACRHMRDPQAEEASLDRLLAVDPQSLRGLIMKGDCRAGAGAKADAIRFYRAALTIADRGAVPPDAVAEVERASVALKALEGRAHAKRIELLEARGLPPESWSPRFARALDIAAGRRKLYLQQPTVFTYPELPHVQYYDPSDFPWAPAIEAATAEVKAELLSLLSAHGTDKFRPYIQGQDGAVRLDANKGLVDSRDWSALFLCENGRVDEALAAYCPRTLEVIQQAPLVRIAGWGPTVMFSLLKAGASIAPHTGMFNTRLVCHLPLIVPPNCRFRVGNEVREWREGKLFIFDDTIEHEARNDSDEDRVVLIFDIWRPELGEQEKREIASLFAHE